MDADIFENLRLELRRGCLILAVLLVSEWREENKRNKRFYRLSPDGGRILEQLLDEWQRINTSLNRILQEA
jgi:PadR family transcriptional regulator PadR